MARIRPIACAHQVTRLHSARSNKEKSDIRFVDTTVRDGSQSLWAIGMRTDWILPIAQRLDRMIRRRQLAAFQITPEAVEDIWYEQMAAMGIRQMSATGVIRPTSESA